MAALIWSQNPYWTAAQVRDKFFNSTDNIDALNPSYAGKLGHGRVNAFKAVSGGTPPPSQEVKVESLKVGEYVRTGKSKTFNQTSDFTQGDTVVFRAHVLDNAVQNVAGATVQLTIAITGSANSTTLSGVTDSQGVAETSWPTSAPNRRKGGTTPGEYTVTVTNVSLAGYSWDNGQMSSLFSLGQKLQ